MKDHETNSIAFGPDGALYFTQGANNAMGAPDGAWGNRAEQLLSAAVLRLDPAKLPATLPAKGVNVRTGDAGSYNPYAANAPLTIYASGIRNAYDLVWHSNGHLYVPTNGSAAGGNVPAVPADGPCPATLREPARRHLRRSPKVAARDQQPGGDRLRLRRAEGRLLRPPEPVALRVRAQRRQPDGGDGQVRELQVPGRHASRTRTTTSPASTTPACTRAPTARSSTRAARSAAR